jgi:hypothetical protein
MFITQQFVGYAWAITGVSQPKSNQKEKETRKKEETLNNWTNKTIETNQTIKQQK